MARPYRVRRPLVVEETADEMFARTLGCAKARLEIRSLLAHERIYDAHLSERLIGMEVDRKLTAGHATGPRRSGCD